MFDKIKNLFKFASKRQSFEPVDYEAEKFHKELLAKDVKEESTISDPHFRKLNEMVRNLDFSPLSKKKENKLTLRKPIVDKRTKVIKALGLDIDVSEYDSINKVDFAVLLARKSMEK